MSNATKAVNLLKLLQREILDTAEKDAEALREAFGMPKKWDYI